MSPLSNNIARDNLRALSLENSNFRKFTVEKETGKLIKVNGAIEWIVRLIKNIFTGGGEDRKVHDIYQKNMIALGKTPLSNREFTISKLKANLLSEKINDLVNKPNVEEVDESSQDIQDMHENNQRLKEEEDALLGSIGASQEPQNNEYAEALRMNEQLSALGSTQSNRDSTTNALLDTLDANKPAAKPQVEEVVVPASNPNKLGDFNWEAVKVVTSLVKKMKNTEDPTEFLAQLANLAFLADVYKESRIDITQLHTVRREIKRVKDEGTVVNVEPVVYDLGSLSEQDAEKKMKAWIARMYVGGKPTFEPSNESAIKAGLILKDNMSKLLEIVGFGGEPFKDYMAINDIILAHFKNAKYALEQSILLMEGKLPFAGYTIGTPEYRNTVTQLFTSDTEQEIERIQRKYNT